MNAAVRARVGAWSNLEVSEQETIALALITHLPQDFQYLGLRPCPMGGRIARFVWHGLEFVLLPGGDVELGFDSDLFVPSPSLRQAWKRDHAWRASMDDAASSGFEEPADDTDEAYEAALDKAIAQMGDAASDDTLCEFLRNTLTPLRRTRIAPFLIQVEAEDAEAVPIPVEEYWNASDVQLIRATRRPGMTQTTYAKGTRIRTTLDRIGSVRVYRLIDIFHRNIKHDLATIGFRLATSDQWEYACAGGTRSLFRWGDDIPERFLPGIEQSDADWSWTKYRLPNGFGLVMPVSPYNWELCDEANIMRGGDGGGAICGGGDSMVHAWVPLTSSYVAKTEWLAERQAYGAHLRRVVPL